MLIELFKRSFIVYCICWLRRSFCILNPKYFYVSSFSRYKRISSTSRMFLCHVPGIRRPVFWSAARLRDGLCEDLTAGGREVSLSRIRISSGPPTDWPRCLPKMNVRVSTDAWSTSSITHRLWAPRSAIVSAIVTGTLSFAPVSSHSSPVFSSSSAGASSPGQCVSDVRRVRRPSTDQGVNSRVAYRVPMELGPPVCRRRQVAAASFSRCSRSRRRWCHPLERRRRSASNRISRRSSSRRRVPRRRNLVLVMDRTTMLLRRLRLVGWRRRRTGPAEWYPVRRLPEESW